MIVQTSKGIASSKILLLIVLVWFIYLGGFRFSRLAEETTMILNKFVELARGIKAYYNIKDLQFSLEACRNANNGKYNSCFDERILREFNKEKNAHFTYRWDFFEGNNYVIAAKRNKFHHGNPENKIYLLQHEGKIIRTGEGLYSFIR